MLETMQHIPRDTCEFQARLITGGQIRKVTVYRQVLFFFFRWYQKHFFGCPWDSIFDTETTPKEPSNTLHHNHMLLAGRCLLQPAANSWEFSQLYFISWTIPFHPTFRMENSPEIRNLWALEVSPGVRALSQNPLYLGFCFPNTHGYSWFITISYFGSHKNFSQVLQHSHVLLLRYQSCVKVQNFKPIIQF